MQSVTDGVYQRHVICLPVREYLLFLLSVCVVSFYIFFCVMFTSCACAEVALIALGARYFQM